jgi:hypothetical protein
LHDRDGVDRAARSRSVGVDENRVIVAVRVHAMLTKTWPRGFLAPLCAGAPRASLREERTSSRFVDYAAAL